MELCGAVDCSSLVTVMIGDGLDVEAL